MSMGISHSILQDQDSERIEAIRHPVDPPDPAILSQRINGRSHPQETPAGCHTPRASENSPDETARRTAAARVCCTAMISRPPVRVVAPGGHLELVGQRVRLDHQAVIPRRLKRIVEPREQPAAVVVDHVGLAVHQPVGPHDARRRTPGRSTGAPGTRPASAACRRAA